MTTSLADWLGWWQRPSQSAVDIHAYQSRHLRHLLEHAAKRVPYYRKRFAEASLDPRDIRSVTDLAKIPISSKQDFITLPLRDRLAETADGERLVPHTTSGSTGVLLEVMRTRLEEFQVHSVQFRAQLLSGLRAGDRRVFLGNRWSPTVLHRTGLFSVRPLGCDLASAGALRQLRALQPDIIVVHPSLLELLLRSSARPAPLAIRPRILFSGAEILSPSARVVYEETFRCPIVDFYGAHEVGHIAVECRSCGLYHTCDDSVIVEILRDGRPVGPGEQGEVVVTALHSVAMPFIRYRLGDIVRRPRRSPSCPISFGAIERIEGRTLDYLDLPGGRRINPYEVVEKLAGVDGVVCFEVSQDDRGRIQVQFEPRPASTDETRTAVTKACEDLFPVGIIESINAVGRIPLSKAGKRCYIRTRRKPV